MDDLPQLAAIQNHLKELNFESVLLPKSETGSLNMLSLKFLNNDEVEQTLIINYLPLGNDLEGSVFIQFYYEYPFHITSPFPNELKTLIHNVNRQLPLGHFNTTVSWSQICYKYILAQSNQVSIQIDQLNDILDMILFSIQHFEKGFSEFQKM